MPAKIKYAPSYPSLALTQNKHRFYFATIPIDDLFPICFVSRRDEDPTAGFQRTLVESRADDIAEYLRAGTGSIPTNIVLSAQPEANLTYSPRSKTVSFDRVRGAFLVLDGQHRLWGYSKCKKKHRVPVAIYEGLDRSQEARLFIDINTNQRGVSAALLLDIKKIAQYESAREGIMRQMFDKLSADPESPVAGKLSPARSIVGKISRVTFNRALGTALDSAVLQNLEGDGRYKLIRNYLNAFDAELRDKRMLLRSAFFEALFEIFDEVIRATMSSHGDAKPESLQEIIRPITLLDFGAVPAGTGKLTKKGLVTAMQTALRKNLQISEDLL
jgi:DGQHR domain-containing protein